MVDALTMISLLFAAILSYATARTPVFTPSGNWHLGWGFAMFNFLCNNGVEHNIMVRRNIWNVSIRNGFMPHIMGYKFITYLCP
jgi:hypothetical protein